MNNVHQYQYNPDRDRRWRAIIDNFCVLEDKDVSDEVVPRLLQAGVERVLEVGSHRGPLAERLAPRGVTTCLRRA